MRGLPVEMLSLGRLTDLRACEDGCRRFGEAFGGEAVPVTGNLFREHGGRFDVRDLEWVSRFIVPERRAAFRAARAAAVEAYRSGGADRNGVYHGLLSEALAQAFEGVR